MRRGGVVEVARFQGALVVGKRKRSWHDGYSRSAICGRVCRERAVGGEEVIGGGEAGRWAWMGLSQAGPLPFTSSRPRPRGLQ